MTVLNFKPLSAQQVDPYAGIADSLSKGIQQGTQYKQNALSWPEQLAQLQDNTKLLNTQVEYAEPNAQANLQKSLLGNQESQINLQTLSEKNRAYINAMNALSKQRTTFGGGKYNDAYQQDLASFINQIKLDNPGADEQTVNDLAQAYMGGQTSYNGQPLPALSSIASSKLGQVRKRASNTQLQNQSAAMDELSNELNNIDIEPAKKFTGISGRIKEGYNAAKSATGFDPSDDYQNYQVFKQQSVEVMDKLRNALKTSVIPGYVSSTLGKLSNPNDSIWSNPSLVQKKWDQTKQWINDNSKNLKTKADYGATAPISNAKSLPNKIDMSHLSDEDLRRIANGQ